MTLVSDYGYCVKCNSTAMFCNECATKEREIQRLLNIVCDSPACTATIVRRDDGSRVCSAGHSARWVNVDLLYEAEAKVTSLRENLRQVLEYFECRSDKAVSVLESARAELEEVM